MLISTRETLETHRCPTTYLRPFSTQVSIDRDDKAIFTTRSVHSWLTVEARCNKIRNKSPNVQYSLR